MNKFLSELGNLVNPSYFNDPLEVREHDRSVLLSYLETMLTIRIVEEIIGEMIEKGQIKCPCHLGIGQEAVATGVSCVSSGLDSA